MRVRVCVERVGAGEGEGADVGVGVGEGEGEAESEGWALKLARSVWVAMQREASEATPGRLHCQRSLEHVEGRSQPSRRQVPPGA